MLLNRRERQSLEFEWPDLSRRKLRKMFQLELKGNHPTNGIVQGT